MNTTLIATRRDLASWTRAHAGAAGICWSVEPGPGGTMLVTEHEGQRPSRPRLHAVPRPAVPGGSRVHSWAAPRGGAGKAGAAA